MSCSSRISFAVSMGVSPSVGIILKNEAINACLILGFPMYGHSESNMQVLSFGTPGNTERMISNHPRSISFFVGLLITGHHVFGFLVATFLPVDVLLSWRMIKFTLALR